MNNKILIAYNLLQPLPGLKPTVNTFPEYIAGIIPFILGLAAVLAVVEIVIGGIEYAVTEAIDAKADAKDRITQAILGLLLALASWLILSTINPALVNLELGIPGLPTAGPVCAPACKDGYACVQKNTGNECVGTTEIIKDAQACLPTANDKSAYQCPATGEVFKGSDVIDSANKCKAACSTQKDIIQPPSAKVEGVCLSSASIVLSFSDTCDVADCGSRGGNCIKAIELPPISPVENKAIVVPGGFFKDEIPNMQAIVDSVYEKLPEDYKQLKTPVLILNEVLFDEFVTKAAKIAYNIDIWGAAGLGGFSCAGCPEINTTVINGAAFSTPGKGLYGGDENTTQLPSVLVHELAHTRAMEKFGDFDGNQEWKDLHALSIKEDKGFVASLVKNGQPLAKTDASEDLAMSTEAYVMTGGQYKIGNARSDEILAQKFAWLEKNGFVKPMR